MVPVTHAYDIICISTTEWDGGYWGTQHQLAWRLAKDHKVLFMDLPISPLTPFTGLHKGILKIHLKKCLQPVRQGDIPNLMIAAPPPVLPFRYHRLTNLYSQKILSRFLTKNLIQLGFDKPLLVTFQADSGALVKSVDACVKIYFCTDDWSASGRFWQPSHLVRTREKELVAACDLVVATSRRLTERLTHYGIPTYFIPNAADFDLFHQGATCEPSEAMRTLPRPVIGFAGLMTKYSFDPNLIERLAQCHPEWTFAIVGKQVGQVDLQQLRTLSNVYFLGYQPYTLLPKFLAGMDVCLIPWAANEWVKSAFSLKLFEYLAAGKPVVATWTEEYLPYSDFVYMGSTYEEFEAGIVQALKENSPELKRQRIELSRVNSWGNRVTRFKEIIDEYLGRQ
jgi:glycosyltransferase involved in cell wall biosynthesis